MSVAFKVSALKKVNDFKEKNISIILIVNVHRLPLM